jgi:hypothetical protein
MRRIIPFTLLALVLSGSVAFADRWRRHDTSDHSGGVRVDHRNDRRWDDRRHDRRWERRDDRRWSRGDTRVVVKRTRPVFRDNRFYFTGGHYRTYTRPVISVRYRDYYRRPAVLVESYDPVPGYIWVRGSWAWDGYEWQWQPGHYEVDASYQDTYYDGGYYNSGVTVGGSISWGN